MQKLTHKLCKRCGQTKPRDQFYITKKGNGEHINQHCKVCHGETNRERRFTPGALLTRAKNGAGKRGIECTITKEDIIIPPRCPVLNVEWVYDGVRHDHAPSLDRIDSTKGYIPGNIAVVCWRVNRLKNNATIDELRSLVEFYSV